MKKKVIAVAAGMMLSLGLSGCGGGTAKESTTAAPASQSETGTASESASASESTSAATSESAEASAAAFVSSDLYNDGLGEVSAAKPLKFGFTMQTRTQFLSTMETAIAGLCKDMGIELVAVDANLNANTQISQIQTFASQGVDAIICNAVMTENGDQIMETAGDIPVAFVNILPTADLSGQKATKIGSNEREAGRFQAEFLSDFFKAKGKTDLSYVMMQGILGLSYTIDRTGSAVDGLAENGLNAICVYEDTGEYDRVKAQNKMQTFLGTGQSFDAVICNNDEMALGCIEAMKSAGIDPKEVPVVGIDATIQALTSMQSGELAMTVFQNPVGQGHAAVRAGVLMAQGKTVPQDIVIAYEKVTPESVQKYIDFHETYQ